VYTAYEILTIFHSISSWVLDSIAAINMILVYVTIVTALYFTIGLREKLSIPVTIFMFLVSCYSILINYIYLLLCNRIGACTREFVILLRHNDPAEKIDRALLLSVRVIRWKIGGIYVARNSFPILFQSIVVTSLINLLLM